MIADPSRAFAHGSRGLVTIKDEPQPIIQAGQRHRPVILSFEILHGAAKGIRLMRLQQPGKFPTCPLEGLYSRSLRQRIVGQRDINCPPQIIRPLQRSPGLAAYRLVIPPETGIDRNVSLKYLRPLKKSVHRKQSANRMPDKNPEGLGSILALNFGDELLADESKELRAAPAGSKIRRLFSVSAFQRVRRSQIAGALRVRERYNNQLRDLGVGAQVLYDPTSGV